MKCFFFGCWNDAGHYLFAPGGRALHHDLSERVVWYGDRVHLDGTLAPRRDRAGRIGWVGRTGRARGGFEYASGECDEGLYLVHVLDNGFTAMSWWDRCQGDTRPGCNSTVLLEGVHTEAEMLAALRENFPHVLENLRKAGVELRPAVHGEVKP